MAGPRSPMRAAVNLAVACAVVRMVITAFAPVLPDEAYYWDWSRHLAASYYDHPVMVALLARIGTAMFGVTSFGVRFGAQVAGFIAVLAMLDIARQLGGDDAAWRTSLLAAVSPLSALGLALLTPDAPLAATGLVAVALLLRAVRAPAGSRDALGWWLAAGAALGLAMLSKYTAAIIPAAVLIALLVDRPLRAQLASAPPYLAGLVALMVASPLIWWNAEHDWVSLRFQAHHGFRLARGSILSREMNLIGGQMGLATPILFVMLVTAVILTLRGRLDARARLVAVLSVTWFAVFAYSATHAPVEANWPALAIAAAIPLAGVLSGSGVMRRALPWAVATGALIVLLAYADVLYPVLPLPARRDPMARGSGFDAMARVVDAQRRQCAPARCFVAANRYQETAELAFHLPDHPTVYSLNVASRGNQYDAWPRFTDVAKPGDDLLFVLEKSPADSIVIGRLRDSFASVAAVDSVVLRRGDPASERSVLTRYQVWKLSGYR